MDNFTQEVENNFLTSLLDTPSLQEHIQTLCNYLAKFTGCDKIFCYEIDRELMQSRIIFTYNIDTDIFRALPGNVSLFWSTESLSRHNKEYTEDVIYYNNLHLLKPYKKMVSLYPECRSMLEYGLFSTRVETKLQKLILFSKKKNGFSSKHVNFVMALRSHIRRLCLLMADTSGQNFLEISSHEEQSISPEQLLLQCSGLREISAHIRNIAKTDSTVLIYGETGVGKELVADTFYLLSPRANVPFQKINCGSLAPSLIDSELFGVVKGAYTGAMENKKGIFENADGGTLFLDEIGELSLDAQARLLRVLEAKEIRRVGDTKIIPVDVRIIAATNKNLESMVEAGSFRKDLFYRLSVFPLYIPSLAERMEDIPILAQYFYGILIKQLNLTSPPKLTEETIQDLLSHSWPGNVRQLKFTMERSLIICCNQKVLHIHDSIGPRNTIANDNYSNTLSDKKPAVLEDAKSEDFVEMISALRNCHNRIGGPFGAAKLLNINPSTFRYKMKKFGITRQGGK